MKRSPCACRRLHGRTRNYPELRIYRNPLLPFSMICCPSNVQQFLRSVGLPGTPSERVRVCLRGKLRISAPTVLFAQSQGKMFKTKYISRQMGSGRNKRFEGFLLGRPEIRERCPRQTDRPQKQSKRCPDTKIKAEADSCKFVILSKKRARPCKRRQAQGERFAIA